MQRKLLKVVHILATALLVASQAQASTQKVPVITRTERCSALNHQLQDVLKSDATAKQVSAAKALQKKGLKLCASKKQAEGILTFANALKLLGAKPVDPDR